MSNRKNFEKHELAIEHSVHRWGQRRPGKGKARKRTSKDKGKSARETSSYFFVRTSLDNC
jgi:hypothetical protein